MRLPRLRAMMSRLRGDRKFVDWFLRKARLKRSEEE